MRVGLADAAQDSPPRRIQCLHPLFPAPPMAFQQLLDLRTSGRGFTDITAQVAALVRGAGSITGLAQVFARHTSCSVLITENADPAVRADLETLAQRWAPDGDPAYRHDTE